VTWQLASILPVWILALIGAVIIGVVTPQDEYLTWLPTVLAGLVILTFFIQLGIQRKEGFVFRAMTSITGATIVLGAATAVLFVIA
jgi:MFS-type transporter involved in bile tolerance (Atg22 family)